MPQFKVKIGRRGGIPGLNTVFGTISPPVMPSMDGFNWKISVLAFDQELFPSITCMGRTNAIGSSDAWHCQIQEGRFTICSQSENQMDDDLDLVFHDIHFNRITPTFRPKSGLAWSGDAHFIKDSSLLVKILFTLREGGGGPSHPQQRGTPGIGAFSVAEANICSLLEAGDGDVVFKLKDGEEVKAHKAILASRSPVFKAMFEARMTEAGSRRVEIPEMGLASFKALLTFVYAGEVDLNRMDLELMSVLELVDAAEKHGFLLFKQLLGHRLLPFVSTMNCFHLYRLAVRYGLQTAEDFEKFIARNMKEVLMKVPLKEQDDIFHQT